MSSFQQALTELKKFDSSMYHFSDGASIESIIDLEKTIGYELPFDFKEFLLFSNGAGIFNLDIYSICEKADTLDIYTNYLFEKDEVGNPIPEYLLPITANGRGDHYCLDLISLSKSRESCNIVFWQYDYEYDASHKPDIEAKSFNDYLLKIMSDYLVYNNYDGTDKIR
jgi:cell wall assembly regulator SMI1